MRRFSFIRFTIQFKKFMHNYPRGEKQASPDLLLRLSRYDIFKAPFQARHF